MQNITSDPFGSLPLVRLHGESIRGDMFPHRYRIDVVRSVLVKIPAFFHDQEDLRRKLRER
jgi:hypothetical protein